MTDPTLTTATDGRWTLRIERHYPHPTTAVWSAITEPDLLREWFPFQVTWDLTVGAPITFTELGTDVATADLPAPNGVVTHYNPPRLLAFDWDGEHLRFELSDDRDGCRLVFTHLFHDRYGAASFGAGWEACLAALGAVIAGVPAATDVDMTARHEELVAILGIDDATVETTDDGVRVVARRQLVVPATAAWERLTGDSELVTGAPPPEGFVVPGFPAGPMSSVEPGGRLSYDVSDAASSGVDRTRPAQVTWRLSDADGTGHGARVELALELPSAASRIDHPSHTTDTSSDVSRARTLLPRHVHQLAITLASTTVGAGGED